MDIPIKAWKAEQKQLTGERFLLCEDYYRLKDEVQNIEVIVKNLDKMFAQDTKCIRKIELSKSTI